MRNKENNDFGGKKAKTISHKKIKCKGPNKKNKQIRTKKIPKKKKKRGGPTNTTNTQTNKHKHTHAQQTRAKQKQKQKTRKGTNQMASNTTNITQGKKTSLCLLVFALVFFPFLVCFSLLLF